MPVGEFIAEMGLRLVVEIVFYGLFYWVGFFVLKVITFGGVTIAPLSTVGERHKARKIDWSIYLYRSGKRMLKAEFTALVGMIFSIVVAWAYFHCFQNGK
jgi:hypothetical protein